MSRIQQMEIQQTKFYTIKSNSQQPSTIKSPPTIRSNKTDLKFNLKNPQTKKT